MVSGQDATKSDSKLMLNLRLVVTPLTGPKNQCKVKTIGIFFAANLMQVTNLIIHFVIMDSLKNYNQNQHSKTRVITFFIPRILLPFQKVCLHYP